MQSNLNPCQGNPLQSIHVNGQELAVCRCRLPVTPAIAIELFVDAYSQDAMTQSIIEQRHFFPPGYRLLNEFTPLGGVF